MLTKPLLPSGRRVKFSHEFHGVFFRSGYDKLFLDKALYEPVHPLIQQEDTFYLSLEDLDRIYAPDMRIQTEGNRMILRFSKYLDTVPRVQIDHQWFFPEVPAREAVLTLGETAVEGEASAVLNHAPREMDGVFYVPVIEVMTQCFGARTVSTKNMTAVTFYEDLVFPVVLWRYYSAVARGRVYGDIHRTFWFEEGQRMIPYHMYIPTSYQPDQPRKAIFYFHGGGGDESRFYDQSGQGAQIYAEDRGYIIAGTNGYIQSSFYGSLVPIIQTIDQLDPAKVDYHNPEGWPAETVELRRLAGQCMEVEFQEIFSHWNLDRQNLFATGNSAGSVACMQYVLNKPGFFNGICPTGGFINYNFYDLKQFAQNIQPNHTLCVCGTEDEHGFDYVLRGWAKMDELGIAYRKLVVGGGDHPSGWSRVTDRVFDFFDSCVTKSAGQ